MYQDTVYIVGVRKGSVTLGRDLKNKIYTLVVFGEFFGLIWSGKLGWFQQNLGREAGVNNLKKLSFWIKNTNAITDISFLVPPSFLPLCALDKSV